MLRSALGSLTIKPPKIGDRVEYESAFGGLNSGVVTQILAAQFTFRDKEDRTHFVLFNENWKKIK